MITSIERALVVDDDVLMREFVIETLRREGLEVVQAGNGTEARRIMDEQDFDLVFMDLKMPGMDGLQVLKHMRDQGIASLVVMVTAFGTVEQAVEAMKIGAMDFLMKPFSPEQVEMAVRKAREWVHLQARNTYLQEELGWRLPGGRQLIGQSADMKRLMEEIRQVSASAATVLVTGESGTGKELVALAIHSTSDRRDGPFVRMNCAAVPDSLMDSELFGHEKGSFTGAVSRRLGRFELANGGTLLLDEVTEMKLEVQSKLLRVLQEQEFERVGGSRTIRTDCRVIATSNRDLRQAVSDGKFRQDLFYRLNVVPLHVPPLRSRPDDVPVLANAFLDRFRPPGKDGRQAMRFTSAAMDRLMAHEWPGNVRELENLVERMTVMGTGCDIDVDSLPLEHGAAVCPQTVRVPLAEVTSVRAASPHFNLAELEQEAILRALNTEKGNRQRTAELLGISIRTLRNKLNQYRREGSLPVAV